MIISIFVLLYLSIIQDMIVDLMFMIQYFSRLDVFILIFKYLWRYLQGNKFINKSFHEHEKLNYLYLTKKSCFSPAYCFYHVFLCLDGIWPVQKYYTILLLLFNCDTFCTKRLFSPFLFLHVIQCCSMNSLPYRIY